MEYLAYIGSFILAISIASVLMQLVMSYCLQVLAEKNELPDFVGFIAWIPVLNIYPMIKVAGFSFARFLIGGIVLGVAAVGCSVAAATMGGETAAMATVATAGLLGVVAIVYVASLMWNTATSRDLSGFIGLLCFIPLVGFFVYPYIAFHDGMRPPSAIGLLLGLLLTGAPAYSQYQMFNTLAENPAALLGGDVAGLEGAGGADAAAFLAQLRALDSMVEDAAAADPGSDPGQGTDPAHAPNAWALAGTPGDGDGTGLCPEGSTQQGAAPPEGHELWCELAGLKHGPYAAWHANGRPSVRGQYAEGLRTGRWTRWYETGARRVEASFSEGLQEGPMVAWNESGEVIQRQVFQAGEPLPVP